MIQDNLDFQSKFGFDKDEWTKERLDFRIDLLTEEFQETHEAYMQQDAEELVDGLIDLIVIALGTLSLSGVDVEKAWKEVFRANMSKQRGVKPGREHSGGVDVFKPEGWEGPNHKDNHGKLDEIFNSFNAS
jgi:predicted HAD superfamily Cof-like phosphohydrolase